MADIKFYIEQIQRAIYGEEVRSSIANALTVVNEDNNGQQALRDEVIHARDDMYDYVNDFNEKMNIADITKQQLVDATHSAEGSREQLNQSIKESSETEITLNEIVRIAEKSRNELDKSNLIAGNTKTQLDNIVKKAAYLDDNLADKIQEGNKLKTDLPVLISNEVKKITDAGTEEVRKVTETGDTVSQLIDGFDYKVTEVMSTIIEQGNTSIKAVADKGAEQTGNVTAEGTKQTEAVQAKGQEVINSIPEDFTTQMETKMDKQQGTENAGKALVIGEDGNVVPGEVQGGGVQPLKLLNTIDITQQVNKVQCDFPGEYDKYYVIGNCVIPEESTGAVVLYQFVKLADKTGSNLKFYDTYGNKGKTLNMSLTMERKKKEDGTYMIRMHGMYTTSDYTAGKIYRDNIDTGWVDKDIAGKKILKYTSISISAMINSGHLEIYGGA